MQPIFEADRFLWKVGLGVPGKTQCPEIYIHAVGNAADQAMWLAEKWIRETHDDALPNGEPDLLVVSIELVDTIILYITE